MGWTIHKEKAAKRWRKYYLHASMEQNSKHYELVAEWDTPIYAITPPDLFVNGWSSNMLAPPHLDDLMILKEVIMTNDSVNGRLIIHAKDGVDDVVILINKE